MRDFFSHHLSEHNWLIVEDGWNPEKQASNESKFTLGNGYIGSRGILEEVPEGAVPGTFFAGLFDITGAQVTEIVNAPNPINIRISIGGERLGVSTMDVLDHMRTLDIRKGVLFRKTLYSNSRKKKFDYQSARFFSMHNKHIAAMKIYFTPLDSNEDITIDSSIDTSITNQGLITEGNKKHFHITDFHKQDKINCFCAKTLEKEILMVYASRLKIRKGSRSYFPSRRAIFNLTVKKGETLCITKYFSFYTTRHRSPSTIKAKAIKNLKKAVEKKFDKLVAEQSKAWGKKWRTSDVEIYGSNKVARALRFNIYHLLIAGNDEDKDISVGAKTLSGEGYRAHVFWDTEIFVLPFFAYTNPKIAKNLLLYRYNRLDAARKIAKLNNYQGAMFPWESADTGEEATPSWYKDPHGNIHKVSTGLMEHHITADIAYGVMLYYNVTGDVLFMLKYGLELLFETARFWASRVSYNKNNKYYEIKDIIGPDEFHEHVDNNAYTNFIAKWNLEQAHNMVKKYVIKHPQDIKEISKKLNLTLKEVDNWSKIAKKISIKKLNTGIYEQFKGFFKLKKLPIPERDEFLMPVCKDYDLETLSKSQYVKQADVVMLFLLFPEYFSDKDKKKNYIFYESRTLHFSSLSASVHSIVGLQVKQTKLAYKYFLTALYSDLKDIYHNTDHGVHAASLGGVWQTAVYGFAGIRLIDHKIICSPKLPDSWTALRCSLQWRGYEISFFIEKNNVTIGAVSISQKKQPFKVIVYGREYIIELHNTVTIKK
ncbi:glycoside hydrolase family 65 protein [bacterium]